MTACLPPMMVPGMLVSNGNSHPMMAPSSHCLSSFRGSGGVAMAEASHASAAAVANGTGGIQRTQNPIVTGASVLAIKYADGVMMMADTLGSYGSMGMFKHLQRMHAVNEHTLLGGSGEYSDLQYILKMLEQLRITDFAAADGATLRPSEIHSYLGRVMYNRRSKVDPLWNQLITAGFYQGKSYVGSDAQKGLRE